MTERVSRAASVAFPRVACVCVAGLVLAATQVTVESSARAALCFPMAGAVSNDGGGPPDWWSAGAEPVGDQTSSFLDDPRWHGAATDSQMEYERFRALVEEGPGGIKYLVMSWEVAADSNGPGDRLYFGFWDETADPPTGNVYRLTRNAAMETPVTGARYSSDAFAARVFTATGAGGAVEWTGTSVATPPYPLPAWLTNDTRVDVSCASPPNKDCDRWAIRLRAPIDPAADPNAATPSGIKLTGPTFRFWYEIQDGGAIGTTIYSFPPGLPSAHELGGTPPIGFPDPTTWRQVQLGATASCEGDIQLASDNVWVNSIGANQLDLINNAFHAQPLNNVPSSVRASLPNGALTARFRIANWGSATYSSPEWRETCTTVPAGGNIASGARFDLGCNWSGFDPCPYRPALAGCGGNAGTLDPHQGILVDLGLPAGSADDFALSPRAVFRNMNFEAGSKVIRTATIDIKGLPPLPGGATTRDVYLYVQTRNLPEKWLAGTDDGRPAEMPSPSHGPTQPNGRQASRPATSAIDPARARFRELELPTSVPIGTRQSARIQSAVQAGRMTYAQVEQLMPTYVVYVWHDTGRTIETDTGPSHLLEPQPFYGLFIAHDGTVEGWTHRFEAEGAVLIGPNLYRVSVPDNSTFTVTTTIEGIECTGPFCRIPLWFWMLLALVVSIVIFASTRRRPSM